MTQRGTNATGGAYFCALLLFLLLATGCSSPEKKIKNAFGDTSSWTMEDWKKQENRLTDKLIDNLMEARKAVRSFAGSDLKDPKNKRIAKKAARAKRRFAQKEDDIRFQLGLAFHAVDHILQKRDDSGSVATNSPIPKKPLGNYTITIPPAWKKFQSEELQNLSREEFYQKIFGPNGEILQVVFGGAFHVENNRGRLLLGFAPLPFQSPDFDKLMRKQVREVLAWNKYLNFAGDYFIVDAGYPITMINRPAMTGVTLEMLSAEGEYEFVALVSPKENRTAVTQLILVCPASWNEERSMKAFTDLLDSLKIAG